MNRAVFPHILGITLACLLGASSAQALELETTPRGAAVFHKVRGKHHFVGYTPLSLQPTQLEGKSFVELLLIKYGHHPASRKLDLLSDPSPTTVALKSKQRAPQTLDSPCEKTLAAQIEKYLASTPLPLELGDGPVIATDSHQNRFVFLGMKIINYDDLYELRRAKRHQSEPVQDIADRVIRPTIHPIIEIARSTSCLDSLQVDVGYRASKGLDISLETTPTLATYSHSWTEKSGGQTRYITRTFTYQGTDTSYRRAVSLNPKTTTLSIRYDLRAATPPEPPSTPLVPDP